MLRYYYRSDSLQDIEQVEKELEQDGFSRSHIHVLSNNQSEMDRRHLPGVPSLFRSDGVHWAERGALMGILVSGILVAIMLSSGVDETLGLPLVLLIAALALGAFTWEGGLIGLQRINYKFEQFEPLLASGQHVLLVDASDSELASLRQHMSAHPELAYLGKGSPIINPFA